MKNSLKSALTATKRLALWFQMRALETFIDGQTKALEVVTCPLTHYKITIARSNARGELATVRGDYNATLPVGVRRTWSMA